MLNWTSSLNTLYQIHNLMLAIHVSCIASHINVIAITLFPQHTSWNHDVFYISCVCEEVFRNFRNMSGLTIISIMFISVCQPLLLYPLLKIVVSVTLTKYFAICLSNACFGRLLFCPYCFSTVHVAYSLFCWFML